VLVEALSTSPLPGEIAGPAGRLAGAGERGSVWDDRLATTMRAPGLAVMEERLPLMRDLD
jgi:hypothetical protein